MGIMEIVWPVTALYFGPAAVAAYRPWGRPMTRRWQRERGDPPDKPGYAVTATGVAHCGAGCTLGDIIAEFAVFGLGASVAGLALGAEYIGDCLAVLSLGIVFRYFAIAPMRGLSLRRAHRGGRGRRRLADRLRGRAVRLDGADDLRVLPGPASPAPGQPGLLVPRATGSSCRSAWSPGSSPPGRSTRG